MLYTYYNITYDKLKLDEELVLYEEKDIVSHKDNKETRKELMNIALKVGKSGCDLRFVENLL
jgi:hypothetical protein